VDAIGTSLAPDVEYVDHRRLGLEPMHGAEAVVGLLRSLSQTVRDTALRVDDILAVQPSALAVRMTNSGTLVDGAGTFERQFLGVYSLGSDGRVTRVEPFDADDETAALARFDELAALAAATEPSTAASGATPKRARRLRPNAATADAARCEAALAARDLTALADQLADDLVMTDHTTGATLDREGCLDSFRYALRVRDWTCRIEPLAALGEALALARMTYLAGSFVRDDFDVGSVEREQIC